MSEPMVTTNIDLGSVEIKHGEFESDVLTLAGADTLKAGTILARNSSTEKLQLYVKGGSSNENGIPKCVLTYELVTETAGSHDVPVRVLVKGVVNLNRLVIDADGDSSNIDGPVRDQLRSYGIVPQDVKQLARIPTSADS
jgi:hypothetical protein